MKLMLIADIHGSAGSLKELIEIYAREGADRLILLGDLLYHGPRNDLPKDYAPKEVITMLNAMKERILAVRGNCDAEVDQMVLEFPIQSDYLTLCVDQQEFYLSHGHLYNNALPPNLRKGTIYIQGHTHIPMAQQKGEFYHVNPGSIALPKEGHPPTYGIYENKNITVKTFSGDCYIDLAI